MAIESTVLDTESAILDNVKKLPESVKQSVLLYTEFLASRHTEKEGRDLEDGKESEEPSSKKPRYLGSMKDFFVLPLPDDFDEPLEEFEEYM